MYIGPYVSRLLSPLSHFIWGLHRMEDDGSGWGQLKQGPVCQLKRTVLTRPYGRNTISSFYHIMGKYDLLAFQQAI